MVTLSLGAEVKSWKYVWEGTEKGRCRVSHEIEFSGDEGDKLYAFLAVVERDKGVDKDTIASGPKWYISNDIATEIQKCSITFTDENTFSALCIDSAGYKTDDNIIYDEDIYRWSTTSSSSSSSSSVDETLYDWLWSYSTKESGDIEQDWKDIKWVNKDCDIFPAFST